VKQVLALGREHNEIIVTVFRPTVSGMLVLDAMRFLKGGRN